MKPKCKLVDTDGNIFAIIGRVDRALELAGMYKEKKEFQNRALSAGSYDEVLRIVQEYVIVE